MKIERVKLATSNAGKLREYQRLAPNCPFVLDVLPRFAEFPAFDEAAPTFAENAAGKALHYSQFADDVVLAEDSGLVVAALDGAPGVRSARYAGENASDADRIEKLLSELRGKPRAGRDARFVCVIALARRGSPLMVVSDFVQGEIGQEPRGTNGFGYDPIFFVPELGRTFAEVTPDKKDRLSHRGKAFRKLIALIGADSRKASAPSQ